MWFLNHIHTYVNTQHFLLSRTGNMRAFTSTSDCCSFRHAHLEKPVEDIQSDVWCIYIYTALFGRHTGSTRASTRSRDCSSFRHVYKEPSIEYMIYHIHKCIHTHKALFSTASLHGLNGKFSKAFSLLDVLSKNDYRADFGEYFTGWLFLGVFLGILQKILKSQLYTYFHWQNLQRTDFQEFPCVRRIRCAVYQWRVAADILTACYFIFCRN